MIFATDIQYNENNTATAAGVLFPNWESDTIDKIVVKEITDVAPYEPGSFYKRELPCILSLLEEIEQDIGVLVVDGYVTLGDDNKPGLGMHLFEHLSKSIPVVGVAKKRFVDTPLECQIFRGQSQNPLYVTSAGVPLSEAKMYITNMHGKNRIPTLLKKVDQVCRGITA